MTERDLHDVHKLVRVLNEHSKGYGDGARLYLSASPHGHLYAHRLPNDDENHGEIVAELTYDGGYKVATP